MIDENYDEFANAKFIRSTGACFLGSGPSTGFWAGKPALCIGGDDDLPF